MTSLKSVGRMSRTGGLVFVLVSAGAGNTAASAQTLITLSSFNEGNGAGPAFGSLILDTRGNLFGTTQYGGASGVGTVFEIAKTSRGYASTPTTLVTFNNTNGAYPEAGLILDAKGDLFGTTQSGGASGDGTVFEIANQCVADDETKQPQDQDQGDQEGHEDCPEHFSRRYASTPTTLVSFDNTNGASPAASLIANANGDLFGTTEAGGAYGDGTVFEMANQCVAADETKQPQDQEDHKDCPEHFSRRYASTPTTLISFDDTNGAYPAASLIADAKGDLFGTTEKGGDSGAGTVFEIAKTSSGYASTPTTLVSFDFTNGAFPVASLIADASGDLFGTTGAAGAAGDGTVFEITKTSSGYASTPTALVNFSIFISGAVPIGGLIADADGNLFGTTLEGGDSGVGDVFEIAKTSSGYASTPNTLIIFDSNDGAYPLASLIADANGDLFGTTQYGGAAGDGTVFEITDSGFVPPRQFAGTPESADCTGKSISTLARRYGGLAHAASALGYAGVTALQSAIHNYCSN